jgi:tyrosinase
MRRITLILWFLSQALSAVPILATSFTAGSLDGTTIRLCFDEPVDLISARNVSNYTMMLVRKEVKELSEREIEAFVTAVRQMKEAPSQYKPSTNAYDYFVELHLRLMDYGIHGSPQFLPWHREFIRRFEAELQRLSGDPLMTLPYWDWASPESAKLIFSSRFMGGDGDTNEFGFVKDGPFRKGEFQVHVIDPMDEEFGDQMDQVSALPKVWLSRGFASDPRVKTLPTREDVDEALAPGRVYDVFPWNEKADPKRSFRNYIEGWRRPDPSQLHNRVHLWVGGQMTSGASPNDPVFYLNHANLDRIWSEWEARYTNETFPVSFKTPDMFGFEDLSVEEMFDIRNQGRKYSGQTGGPIILEAQPDPDGRAVNLVLKESVNGFWVGTVSLKTASGARIRASARGRAYHLSATDIGNASGPGASFSCHDDVLTLRSAGLGLRQDSDTLRFVYMARPVDFDLKTQIQKLEPEGASVTMMARASLHPRSDTIGVAFSVHGTNTLWSLFVRPPSVTASLPPSEILPFTNAWIRFARRDGAYSAYASSNGVDWTNLFRNILAINTPGTMPIVGLGGMAGPSGKLATIECSRFSEVQPLPVPVLSAVLEETDAVVSWFGYDPGYLLEASAAPRGPWIPAARTHKWQNQIPFPAEAGAIFFRLRKTESPEANSLGHSSHR